MSTSKRQTALSLNNLIVTSEGDRQDFLDLLPSLDNPTETYFHNEIQERIQQIVHSPQWQTEHPRNRPHFNLATFLHYKYQGLTYKAIAKQLGVSPEYAASHWQRKFQPLLRNLLQDLWEELP